MSEELRTGRRGEESQERPREKRNTKGRNRGREVEFCEQRNEWEWDGE